MSDDVQTRLAEAEAIIRAQNQLILDMYDTDMESAWSKEAGELQRRYQEKYDVDLSSDAEE